MIRAVASVALGVMVMGCISNRGVVADPNAAARPPAVAGQFYPSDRAQLISALDGFFRNALPPQPADPVAIVVPHAGYVFSGQIAADAYRYLAGRNIETVVILGANHTGQGYGRMAVFDGSAFRTPIGSALVDRELAAAIVNAGAGAVFDGAAHVKEHSVEVQVPFVQRICPSANIVPIVVGDPEPGACARFGQSLAKVLAGRRAIIVASSDLSHYPSREDAVKLDAGTLEAVASLDVNRLGSVIARTMAAPPRNAVTCACGDGAIRVAMTAARALGATTGSIVSYANSADTIVGDPERVVGYGSVVFSRTADGSNDGDVLRPAPDPGGPLDAADKRVLLRLARETISSYLESGMVPLPRGGSGRLTRETGVFVTLKLHGQLRGCIGRLQGQGPALRLVSAMAFESAFKDRRFDPVRPGELSEIEIEVSLLTPMRPIPDPSDIEVGRDGVVLIAGGTSAVFLPEVATEQGWNRVQMLDNLAVKAGLPASAWRDANARLMVFRSEVFSEKSIR